MPRFTRLRQQAGFTLVEVLVACVVLLTGFIAVGSVFDLAKKTTELNRSRVVGTSLARELVEVARGLPYSEISDATVPPRLQAADPSLADTEVGVPYTIVRRNITYTIATETCVMDDGRDGGGASPRTGDYCPNAVAVGTPDPRNGKVDPVPEDYKRVDVVASWRSGPRSMSVRQSTMVNNPGSAGAPAVLTLTPRSVGTPPVVGTTGSPSDGSVTSVVFDLTTSMQPFSVKWLVDGVSRAVLCSNCTGQTFSFTWDLESPTKADDGPYLIGAEAYDRNSVAGPSRSTTIVLNRSWPRPPAGLAGGRNNGVVELEWLPNPERDLTGYSVRRIEADGSRTLICGRQIATTCVDANPPDAATVRYEVRAWDVTSNGTTPRENVWQASTVDVVKDNRPPFEPVAVTKTAPAADGSITLVWAKPSPEDPDAGSGDRIAFYRIYRDGMLVANRHARMDAAGSSTHTYTDGNAGGIDRRYWVVAVDKHYAESKFVEATR